eukprot:30941-Pelagococcus_subviridis.AAC.14
MLHEAAIATRALGGVDAFWKFSAALFAAQTEYFDANVYDTSRSAMYAKLAALAAASAGVDEEEVMKMLARTEAHRRRTQHRQRVHARAEVPRQAREADGDPRLADDDAERDGLRHVLGVGPREVESVFGSARRGHGRVMRRRRDGRMKRGWEDAARKLVPRF